MSSRNSAPPNRERELLKLRPFLPWLREVTRAFTTSKATQEAPKLVPIRPKRPPRGPNTAPEGPPTRGSLQ
eukprot:7342529-Pyramimonas_sp.AAC.1